MKNQILDPLAVRDIESQAQRVLRDIGYSGGKVSLADLREVLRLDLQYYSLADPTLVDEVVHRLRVAGKQMIARPTLLFDAVRAMDLRALFLPDRKRILMDEGIPDLKKRWAEAHEIAHSITPWHADYMLGDTFQTLSQSCQETIEAEANFGAGRLLFPHQVFRDVRLSGQPTMSYVHRMAKDFGNTITSTLWRFVEDSDDLTFATIGQDPRSPKSDEPMVAYLIRSLPFAKQFPAVGEEELLASISECCGIKRRGPLGSTELRLRDESSTDHVFTMEAFSNGYQVLTIGVHIGVRPAKIIAPAEQYSDLAPVRRPSDTGPPT